MSAREQLHLYIQQLERRLRLDARLRGAAICAASALVATVVLVACANHFAFSRGSLAGARWTLALTLAAALGFGLVLPLRRLSRRRAIQRAEAKFSGFQQRLTTFSDRDQSSPFAELLAADTLALTPQAPPQRLAPDGWLFGSLGTGIACLGVLIWLIAAGPGYWGYGARLLWTGPRAHAVPLYSLKVTPGNALVRRHGDQLVSALPHGLASPQVRLYARYQSASKWEEAPMRPQTNANSYQYLFAGLPEDVDYYVEAGALRSPTYHIRVRDLPAVKQISVTYHYPSWTGLKDVTDPHAGDLHAVAGTRAELAVTTDQPLQGGELALDNGQRVPLTNAGSDRYRGTLIMQKDGVYHVAALIPGEDQSQPARLSEDFFIAAPPAAPPQIALARPGRDYRASPIEEVTVAAKASDEYGLKGLALHYSVNGGPEKTVDLLKHPGAKSADGQTVLSLEDFKAQPGDLISVYASARDGNTQARTDMFFIQADPFEREFSQSQQSGGGGGQGGGQGNESAQIADREKEIIAATFKQQGDKSEAAQLAADTAKLLSESQSALHDQALSLSGRMESRELTDQNQAFSDFQKDMIAAAEAMAPATQSLQGGKWPAAIPNEEKALRYLLRADATFRQIQVAFGARGGGGGGGGSAARDLASLFDLELDTQKNQYETQQTASTAEQKAQTIDDALKKLDELAQRQQELAQPQNKSAQSAQERWQQDMLRREAEQLQKQLQSLAGNQGSQSAQSSQGSQGSQGTQGSQSSQDSRSAQGSPSSRSQQQQAAQAALNRLQQANDAMQRAGAQGQNSSQAAADAEQAAAALRQAYQALAGLQQQDAASRLTSMAGEADQLARAQKQQADQVRQLIAAKKPASEQTVDQLVNQRQQVSDQFDQLEKTMRNAARDLNATQPAASSKLRNALDGADSSDLATRLQRSSDWLRSGSFSDSSETSLTNDLQQLGQQVRQAQQALGGAQNGNSNTALAGAMSQIERLRQQIAALGGPQPPVPNDQHSANGSQAGRQRGPAGQQYQAGQLSRSGQQSGNPGGQQSAQSEGQQAGRAGGRQGGQAGGQRGGQSARNGQTGGQQAGYGDDQRGGAIGDRGIGDQTAGLGRNGGILDGRVGDAAGGYRDRYGNGGYDMGNTHIIGQAVAPQVGPNPADTERAIQQDLSALNQLRQSLPNDAETQRQIQALIQQMQGLDPSRFPGNPAEVEAIHQELLTSVDTLELQLRKKLDDSQGGQIRGQNPQPASPGFEDAVAAYYRQLSGGH